MSNLPIIDLSTESGEWKKIINKHGDGQIQPRYEYQSECTEATFPNHEVVRGKRPDMSVTGTGFLRNQTGQVVAGVNQIPK